LSLGLGFLPDSVKKRKSGVADRHHVKHTDQYIGSQPGINDRDVSIDYPYSATGPVHWRGNTPSTGLALAALVTEVRSSGVGRMKFRILGSLEAEAATGERLVLGGPSEQKVLAVLLLNAGHVVPVTRLVDALWDGDPPATASKQAQNTVGRLRRLLARNGDPDAVLTESAGYRIRTDGTTLDARLFEAKVAQAQDAALAGKVADAATLLGQPWTCGGVRRLPGCPGRSSTLRPVPGTSGGVPPRRPIAITGWRSGTTARSSVICWPWSPLTRCVSGRSRN
jgi:DNA-binding winged helix-turn-helix (wHTH) protein